MVVVNPYLVDGGDGDLHVRRLVIEGQRIAGGLPRRLAAIA
ncbi:hypothetical protein [Streptomyces sp. URMC 124]